VRTFSPKDSDITRQWHVIDASGVVLGRLASQAAVLLRGKHKPIFAPHVDTGDFVVIINADKVALSGNKLEQKQAYRHSGYPGGLRSVSYGALMEKHPGHVLDERKLAVLRAIVEDYVSTHEPVGSKSLVDRHNLDVSPATIRNDMAVLEEQGYITQPHTSAGRVPTDKGYRLFVDRLSHMRPLSAAERRAIQTYLAQAYGLDDVVVRTVRLLAQLTRQVAVVQYPSLTRSVVRHIELVRLAPEKLLVVLITDTGRVEQRTVDLPDPCEDEDVAHLRALLNANLDGRRLTEAVRIVAGLTENVPPAGRPNAVAVFAVIMANLEERNEERIVLGGTANLAAPDFSRGLREVLEALEEQVVLMRLLGQASDESLLSVMIGTENPVEGLQTTSLVTSGYGSGGETLARLAVLGPTRMDYPGTMGAVSAVARYVGEILMES